MTLGEKLSKLRRENNYTQEQLAGILGVSRQAISKWESDVAFPETDKIIKLSDMYNCSLDYLLKDDVNEKNSANSKCMWNFKSIYFEKKSKRSIKGIPLWHINFGFGRTAKGIIAIGLISKGIFSFGVLSVGFISFGVLSLGLLSLGAFAFGILSAGSVAAGIISAGAISFGIVSMGAVAVGQFSAGALAIGQYAAIGDEARAMIALGQTEAVGSAFEKVGEISSAERQSVVQLLDEKVPVYLGWAKVIFKMFL